MKEKLLFQSVDMGFINYIKKQAKYFTLLVLRVSIFLFFLIPSAFKANADQIPAEQQPSNNSTIIYVSAGVQIFGESNISNAKVVRIGNENTSVSENKEAKIPKKASVKSLARLETKAYKKAKEIQNKLSKTVQVHYCPNSTDKNSVQMGSRDGNGVVITNTDHSFKFAKAFVPVAKITPNFEGQITKQKYYTSLSFLQFGKYRSSSLRAPPIFS